MTNDGYELDERLFSIVGNSPDVDAIREIIDEQLREAERRGGALVGTQGSQQTIWREGDRIRRTDGTGYSDMVGDEQIRQHIVSMDDDFFAAFAEAVLAIRAFERASTAASAVSS